MCFTLKRIWCAFPFTTSLFFTPIWFVCVCVCYCFSLVIFKGNKDVWQSYSFCIFSTFDVVYVSDHLQWESMKFICIKLKIISKNGSRFTQNCGQYFHALDEIPLKPSVLDFLILQFWKQFWFKSSQFPRSRSGVCGKFCFSGRI